MRNFTNGSNAPKKFWSKPQIKAELSIRETLGPTKAGGDGKSKSNGPS